jgi:NADH-quinone oxidoreductase subunit C
MDLQAITDILRAAQPDADVEAGAAVDQPTLLIGRERIGEVGRLLRDHPGLRFSVLVDVTAVDYLPREPRFEVVYHLVCLGGLGAPAEGAVPAPARLRLKVPVPGDQPRLPTVSDVWPSAEWAEREVWDLFGIEFDGHPDLRRILMPDDWEGHPLRKDYPVQVALAAATASPLQVSEQQFVANIEAARRHGGAAAPGNREGGPGTP